MSHKRAKRARQVVRVFFPNVDRIETAYQPVKRTFRVKEWPVPIGTNADGTPKHLSYTTVTFERTSFCFKSLVRRQLQGAAR